MYTTRVLVKKIVVKSRGLRKQEEIWSPPHSHNNANTKVTQNKLPIHRQQVHNYYQNKVLQCIKYNKRVETFKISLGQSFLESTKQMVRGWYGNARFKDKETETDPSWGSINCSFTSSFLQKRSHYNIAKTVAPTKTYLQI